MATSLRCLQWQCTAGSLANLQLVESPLPSLPNVPGFAFIRVKYVGLNFADMFACLGLYSATPQGSFVPGLEFSGVVEAVSDGTNSSSAAAAVLHFEVGDQVFGVTRFGGYSSVILADVRYIRKIPAAWNAAHGAAFPCQALTAWYGLVELANVKRGQVALIHSAAGGTGLWALRICARLGVRTVATVSTRRKAEDLLRLEPSLTPCSIIVRDECQSHDAKLNALKTALADRSASQFHVVFDSLMGDWFSVCYDCLAPMGRHIVLGAGSMTPHGDSPNWLQLGYRYWKRPRLDPLAMIAQNKSVMAFNLIWLYENTDDVGRLFADLLEAAADMPPPHIGVVTPFAEAPEALRRFQSGATVGKCLLVVEE